jgi:hypothetical protein
MSFILKLFIFSIFIIFAESNGLLTIIGNGQTISSGDFLPAINSSGVFYGIYVTNTSNVYVCDYGGGKLRFYNNLTKIITIVAGGGPIFQDNVLPTATNMIPTDVFLDLQGNIYISDFENFRIRMINITTGLITTVVGNGIDNPTMLGDNGLAIDASIGMVQSIFIDKIGNLYLSDTSNNRVRKVSASTKIITTIAGTGQGSYCGDGGLATNACLNFPYGIYVDNSLNLYIADYNNNLIRFVNSGTGIINTLAGSTIYNSLQVIYFDLFNISGWNSSFRSTISQSNRYCIRFLWKCLFI